MEIGGRNSKEIDTRLTKILEKITVILGISVIVAMNIISRINAFSTSMILNTLPPFIILVWSIVLLIAGLVLLKDEVEVNFYFFEGTAKGYITGLGVIYFIMSLYFFYISIDNVRIMRKYYKFLNNT